MNKDHWDMLVRLADSFTDDEVRKAVAEHKELERQFAQDGIYPEPDDEDDFLQKYVIPAEQARQRTLTTALDEPTVDVGYGNKLPMSTIIEMCQVSGHVHCTVMDGAILFLSDDELCVAYPTGVKITSPMLDEHYLGHILLKLLRENPVVVQFCFTK